MQRSRQSGRLGRHNYFRADSLIRNVPQQTDDEAQLHSKRERCRETVGYRRATGGNADLSGLPSVYDRGRDCWRR